MREIKYHIDTEHKQDKKIILTGWAFSTQEDAKVDIQIKELEHIEMKKLIRVDVQNAYKDHKEARQSGFEIAFDMKEHLSVYHIVFSDGEVEEAYQIDIAKIKKEEKQEKMKYIKKIITSIRLNNLKKVVAYMNAHGWTATIKKIKAKLNNTSVSGITYEQWFEKVKPSKAELENQRNYQFGYKPLISIVVPTYNTPKKFLEEMVQSVVEQTYSNWELCLADGGSKEETKKLLQELANKNSKIKVNFLEENKGISENTNAALDMAQGDYIALLDHDDLLTPDALYEVVKVINVCSRPDFIYTDEDKIDENSTHLFDPHFKPDYAPDTLRSYNYITHFSVFSKEVLEKSGKFNSQCDGSQDYDIILRITEKANKVIHIPKILYHWRTHMNSVALNPESKRYAYEAAKVALANHMERVGLQGKVEDGKFLGSYKINYTIVDTPKVSIIIPNKDHKEDLEKCINSILRKSMYKNIEIIIVENNSETEEIQEYYKSLEKYSRIKVVTWEGKFNYSAINNFGAKHADGQYMILLNNDTEVINPFWIEEMLMYCQREDVGVVGAKLYYPDDTVQHGGVVIGLAGSAGHIHHGILKEEYGYFGRASVVQNLNAVTAACLMIKTSVFKEINGLDENLAVAFNDVDMCLRVRELGYLIIFNPYAELYHYESKSRGIENTPEKLERFQQEEAQLKQRWKEVFLQGDCYYNPNLSLQHADFRLKE
ncbi:MAG: glycosyltransferase family 2 protein [Cellulosilyticum sp.]|nr:glycosyltransferase family 2 protein [Cellulosilyticum sp.]